VSFKLLAGHEGGELTTVYLILLVSLGNLPDSFEGFTASDALRCWLVEFWATCVVLLILATLLGP
jgi:hypothetical protein